MMSSGLRKGDCIPFLLAVECFGEEGEVWIGVGIFAFCWPRLRWIYWDGLVCRLGA